MPLADQFIYSLFDSDLETDLQRARWLATWLDSKFNFLGFKFGMEGIINLLPFAGDTLTTAAGIYPIYVAHRHRLGTGVQAAMVSNLAIQWILGLLPFIGDLADVWYKANLRNLKLLEQAASPRSYSPALSNDPSHASTFQ